ncbi:hypothetical protein AB4097_09745 [Microvirga sp. 2MCAF35]
MEAAHLAADSGAIAARMLSEDFQGCPVVHCYFHLVHTHERIVDEAGIEVSDLEAAHYQALKAIQELRQEGETDEVDWRGWNLEVVDEDGNVLLSIPLNVAQH